jgi:hypothetical protein
MTLLWVLVALALGVGVTLLFGWIRRNSIKPSIWFWLLGGVGLLLVLMALQHYVGTMEEMLPTAAVWGAMLFGIPGILLLAAAAWRIVTEKQTRATS